MRKKKSIKVLTILGVCLGLLVALSYYVVTRILDRSLDVNTVWSRLYSVKGVDVSHYQANINWKQIKKKGMTFAFIKATEGSSCVDSRFQENWEQASTSGLMIGAYHFFSFDSSANTQADNYIQTVGSLRGKLPPVIDFEFYGDKKVNKPSVAGTRNKLHQLLDRMEQAYGVKPIIYATWNSYQAYIKGDFKNYPLWIRNVYISPDIHMFRQWTFWQYTDQGCIPKAYDGTKSIDMNCFSGTVSDMKKMIVTE